MYSAERTISCKTLGFVCGCGTLSLNINTIVDLVRPSLFNCINDTKSPEPPQYLFSGIQIMEQLTFLMA